MTMPPPPLPACGGLEKLAMRLLEKAPENRLRNALEVVRAIDGMVLDGSSDGFASDTEQMPVQSASPTVRAMVEVFDRPPIAEADTPREDDVPTLKPEDEEYEESRDNSGDLEAPNAPVEHDPAESATTRDTAPDDLHAPGLPEGASVVRVDSARTRLLKEEAAPLRAEKRFDWAMLVFIGGVAVFLTVLILSLSR